MKNIMKTPQPEVIFEDEPQGGAEITYCEFSETNSQNSGDQLQNSGTPAEKQGFPLPYGRANRLPLKTQIWLLKHYGESLHWEESNTGHQKLYKLFLEAARRGISPNIALKLAYAFVDKYKVRARPCDFEPQLRNAYRYIGKTVVGSCIPFVPYRTRGPKFSPEKLMSYVADMPELTYEQLRRISPVYPSDSGEFLRCIFGNENAFITGSLKAVVPDYFWTEGYRNPIAIHSPQGVFFLINPITGEWKEHNYSKSGESCRSEDCISKFKYLLLESDHKGYEQQWIQFLCKIPFPVVSIVSSGGRSLHALLRVDAETKEEWNKFRDTNLEFLVEHGADRAAMTAVRLSRLPFCYRGETNKMQELLFLNPNADGTPIFRREGGIS